MTEPGSWPPPPPWSPRPTPPAGDGPTDRDPPPTGPPPGPTPPAQPGPTDRDPTPIGPPTGPAPPAGGGPTDRASMPFGPPTGFGPPPGAFPVYTYNAPIPSTGTNGLAIASLVVSIVGFGCVGGIGSIVALVLGYVALSQIRRSRGMQQGRGLALAGVILGWIGLAVTVAAIIAIVALDSGSDVDDPDGFDSERSQTETPTTVPRDVSESLVAAEVVQRTPPTPAPPTATGDDLETATLIAGVGDGAAPGDTLIVHYVGVLADGTVFDESWEGAAVPFSFELGAGTVIAGWDEGLVGARVGERRHLDIGPERAYGSVGSGSAIPPDAALAFDVDVIEIQRGG
jgi:peptidylprolyl isomerase